MIIFHGTGKKLGKEFEKYHPGVIVEFNETAYMTDQLFLKYIESYLIPALENRPSLFALNLCTSHKTPAVLGTLRNHNITPSLIPAGCTSLIQPLDISINKPLKERIRDLTDESIFEYGTDKWSVGDRRVLTTWCVGDAWYQFCIERQEVIKKSFRDVGLSLPIDSSADYELNIKGFDDIHIGDWRIGSEQEKDSDLGTQFADVGMEHDNNELVEFVAYGE